MRYLIAFGFTWTLAGSVVWMFNAASCLGFACGAYARRHGRLPSAATQALACLFAILLWPRVVMARRRAAGWSR